MVYCGKPSKSCRHCRKRDIKCDKRKDSCRQCIRAHIVCPGYPDPENLVFRDETKKVARKAGRGKKQPKGAGPALTKSSTASELSTLRNQTTTTPPTLPTLPILPPILLPVFNSLEERAKSFFMSNYVFSPLSRIPTSSVLHSFSSHRPVVLHLLFAAQAVYLAYFSKYHNFCSLIMQKARLNYGAALKHTQGMISDPEGAKKDSTLVAVLLLDIFEKIARSNIGSGEGGGEEGSSVWKEAGHLDGAMALVKFRGKNQFDSLIGMNLFQKLSSVILTSCLEKETEVPAQFVAVRKLAARSRDTSDLRWKFEEVVMRLISLKAGLKNWMIRGDENDSVARDLVNECLALCHLHQNHQVSPPDLENGSSLSSHQTESTTTNYRILNHLYIIRLVLAEITTYSFLSSRSKASTTALCKYIYASATNIASFTAPWTFFFPLYVAARSRFCPSALKEQIKALIRRQKDADVLKIVQLLEKTEDALWVREGSRMSNPWMEFAEQGLGELIVFGVF